MFTWLTKFTSNVPSAHAGHKHVVFESVDELAQAMRKAADAHHVYEQAHGKDENWPEWYANYMSNPQDSFEALTHKPEVTMAVPVDFSACHMEVGPALSKCMNSIKRHAAQALTTAFTDTRVRY
jgi:hypothetical protein